MQIEDAWKERVRERREEVRRVGGGKGGRIGDLESRRHRHRPTTYLLSFVGGKIRSNRGST